MAGDQTVNVGIIVRQILATGSKAYGMYVELGTEVWTMEQYMAEWAKIKGVACTYVQCSADVYAKLWGPFGEEMVGQMEVFAEVDPRTDRGSRFMAAHDLGIGNGELVGSREALEKLHAAGTL